jgi:hypothetical protein|tara:strand:- start:204 stop:551 length:348 start_codon:yes stop_codon:yes gene_type:complete
MQGYLINPFDNTIKPVILSDVDSNLKQIYALLDCTIIDAVYSIDDHTIFVDDEGLFVENQRFFKLFGQPLAGKALVLGVGEEGDSKDAELWVEDIIEERIEWTPIGTKFVPRLWE